MADAKPNGARLLVVDDEPEVVSYLVDALALKGYRITGAGSVAEALALSADARFDLIVSDVEMPDQRGLDLLAALQARPAPPPVLLMTAFGSIDLAVQALRAGACDFVTKPFRLPVLINAIERALRERAMRREIVRLRSHLAQRDARLELHSHSPAMQRAYAVAARIAPQRSVVLITGESGVGKGHLAQAIHAQSGRSGPLTQLNCAALPGNLVEAELFGVERGAFTDAGAGRPGLFCEADGGTLFLDEIAELRPEAQAKLLQAIETGRIRAVGGRGERAVDVRILAATHQDLEAAVAEGRFRADLYYRLAVIRLHLPPLRERLQDLPLLCDLLLEPLGRRLDRPLVGISAAALRRLEAYPWPGNVRELANVLERALALCDHDTLLPEDLDLPGEGSAPALASPWQAAAWAERLSLQALEQAYIDHVVAAVGGNKSEAARLLGIDRRTVYRRLEE